MRVDWAIPCRFVENSGAGATIIGAGADIFDVTDLPADVVMMIVTRLVSEPSEGPGEHTLKLELLDGEMSVIDTQQVPFSVPANPNRIPGWEAGHIVGGAHRFHVERSGKYSVIVSVDESPDNRAVPFLVRTPAP